MLLRVGFFSPEFVNAPEKHFNTSLDGALTGSPLIALFRELLNFALHLRYFDL